MDKEKTLKEYHNIVDTDSAKARNLIKKLHFKDDHFLLQCIARTYWDEAKFDKDGIWQKNTDSRKLRMAERYIVKAFKLKPTCSNVLWYLGLIRWDYGPKDVAIYCFHEIIRPGFGRIVNGCCKNDLGVALAQINDSKFQLFRLYKKINPSLSKRYLTLYEKGLKEGVFTLYKPLRKFINQ